MTAALAQKPTLMTVDDFLVWPGDRCGTIFELVEGVPRAQAPASEAHATVQSNLIQLIGNHLRSQRPGCRVLTNPGVQPRLRAKWNFRVPDIGVTCAPTRAGQIMTPDPILLVEVLSPSNEDDTWSNIPLYASLPTVTEMLIVHSTEVRAELLRRGADLSWPQDPEAIEPGGVIRLASIGCDVPLLEVYRETHLATAS